MRTVTVLSAGVAVLGLLVGSMASSAVVRGPAAIAVVRAAPMSSLPRRPRLRNHEPPSPTPCTSGFPTTSFNAIHGVADHAGGDDSAVLAGKSNDACDQSTSVTGGDYNVVGRGATESFIGGGYVNAVSAPESGIMAGSENNVAASNAGVGAGDGNSVYPNGGESFIAAGDSNNLNAQQAFIGAGISNSVTGVDAFIGAGEGNDSAGESSSIGAGQYNNAIASGSFIGAGFLNQVSASGNGSFIGAGDTLLAFAEAGESTFPPGNQISGTDSFIGAGDQNRVTGNGSMIGTGGSAVASAKDLPNNQIAGNDSFVGAGDDNSVSSNEAFIGSGQGNSIAAAATYSAIVGGSSNQVTGPYASVGGGSGNIASGSSATVPGGYHNLASGQFSFAAGFGSYANRNGTFVWSDDSPSAPHLQPTAANQFIARATGGVIFYTNARQTTGVALAAGSGVWGMASDRNLKRNVVQIDDAAILAKVAALPVAEWSYDSEGGVRHVGPMAQDFYAAFRVGEDDRHITSIDEDGVALAAIKALHAENAKMRDENVALRNRLDSLERKVASLSTAHSKK
jgi:hypothetical protein